MTSMLQAIPWKSYQGLGYILRGSCSVNIIPSEAPHWCHHDFQIHCYRLNRTLLITVKKLHTYDLADPEYIKAFVVINYIYSLKKISQGSGDWKSRRLWNTEYTAWLHLCKIVHKPIQNTFSLWEIIPRERSKKPETKKYLDCSYTL